MNIMQVTGNSKEGYYMEGKKLFPIDKNTCYHPDSGYWKVITKNGRFYLTNSENFSLMRVHWYDSLQWQVGVVVVFLLISCIVFVLSMIQIIKGIFKKSKKDIILPIPSILRFGVTVYLIITNFLFFLDIHYAGVEAFLQMHSIIAFVLVLCGGLELISSLSSWIYKEHMLNRIIRTLASSSFVVLLLWMIQIKLIG